MAKPPKTKEPKESKNKGPNGEQRNYKFGVEYDEVVKPPKDKDKANQK